MAKEESSMSRLGYLVGCAALTLVLTGIVYFFGNKLYNKLVKFNNKRSATSEQNQNEMQPARRDNSIQNR